MLVYGNCECCMLVSCMHPLPVFEIENQDYQRVNFTYSNCWAMTLHKIWSLKLISLNSAVERHIKDGGDLLSGHR